VEVFRHCISHELDASDGVVPLSLIINDIDSISTKELALDAVFPSKSMLGKYIVVFKTSNPDRFVTAY
jgi:hypothetical protein